MNHKIIIVDDHALYRLGVRFVINEHFPEASIIGEYESGKELFVYLQHSSVMPDIVLLDIVMPELSGIEIAKILKKDYPYIKIIMLSSETDKEKVDELLNIGVESYLSKSAVQNDLTNAINSVLEGKPFYCRDISKIIYDIYVCKVNAKKDKLIAKDVFCLTKREQEIISALCKGMSAKEIAEKLYISQRTIETHKANVLQKLGFHTTAELIKYAIKEGIVSL